MKPVFAEIGLSKDELTPLDVYTTRMVIALAHLREFWRVGDAADTEAIEDGIRAISTSYSFRNKAAICVKVLSHGLHTDQVAMFLAGCGLAKEAATAAGDADPCATVPHTIFKCRVKNCPRCAAPAGASS